MHQTRKRWGGAGSFTKKINRKVMPVGIKATHIQNTLPKYTSQALNFATIKPVSIRRIPDSLTSAKLFQPARPKSIVLSNTTSKKKYNLPRIEGSRNIFKSMKSRQNFKKMLTNIYGETAENVYTFWTTYKNNLWEHVKERERQFKHSNATNLQANTDLFKVMTNIYGKNFAEFQNYKTRANNVGIHFPFAVKGATV